MKKTCMNCRRYHAVLSDNAAQFHIHDWCDQWKTALDAYALADKMEYECPFNICPKSPLRTCSNFAIALPPILHTTIYLY